MKKDVQVKRGSFFRHNAMKMLAAALLALAAAIPFPGSAANAETLAGGEKVLVVYYSRTGNTRAMAGQIQAMVGGDIVELETVHPYPADYRATTEQAQKELEANFMPPLKVDVDDIAPYGVIFVGSPSWWATFASPVRAFLSGHDFSGKKVVPFITHEGSGMGGSVNDLKSLCPGATILEGLAVRGSKVNQSEAEIRSWLKHINMIE